MPRSTAPAAITLALALGAGSAGCRGPALDPCTPGGKCKGDDVCCPYGGVWQCTSESSCDPLCGGAYCMPEQTCCKTVGGLLCVADPTECTNSDAGTDSGPAAPPGVPDPLDNGGTAGGDDALDAVSVDSAHTAGGGVWVRVYTAGAWPPESTLYSWYVTLNLHDSTGAATVSVTTQRHMGVPADFYTGVAEADVQIVQHADGVLVYFPVAPAGKDSFSVELGVQPTPAVPRVSDYVPDPMGATSPLDARLEEPDLTP